MSRQKKVDNMGNLESISKRNIEKAFEIIAKLEIQKTWENLNSTCNLVGSVKTGLIMNKLDVDFHIYSNDFSIEKSFSAIAQISRNPKIKEVTYRNLLAAIWPLKNKLERRGMNTQAKDINLMISINSNNRRNVL